MDNTSRDAVLARKAGMSYGQWKILHPETAPKKVEKKYKYQRVCNECGKEFGTDRAEKVFCCSDCTRAFNERKFARKRREKLRAMSQL